MNPESFLSNFRGSCHFLLPDLYKKHVSFVLYIGGAGERTRRLVVSCKSVICFGRVSIVADERERREK